jgi:xylulokinase
MSLDGESFGVFGTIQSAGKCVEWARLLFNIENGKLFDAEAQNAEPGSGGLLFLPYIDGERSPIFDANARGVFFNINSGHGRADFTRAVLEGVSYALRSILDVYRETIKLSDLRIIGGGANSGLWLQIIADICKTNVWTTKAGTASVTSLGVALAAAVGVGAYKTLDDASAAVGLAGKTIPQTKNFPVYDTLFDKYLRLYPQIKMLY